MFQNAGISLYTGLSVEKEFLPMGQIFQYLCHFQTEVG